MIDLKDLSFLELEAFLKEHGEPRFRAKQIFSWLHKGVEDFSEMTDISKKTVEKLSQVSFISKLSIREKYVSKIDKTVKYLFSLEDGNCIESVVMRYKHGISLCISSQVGCRMGCGFCASTIGGLYRNLTAGEILNQVIFSQKDIGERISNIVIMGIGEPMDNYENIVKFLKNVNDPNGLNIGYRHISLSTCGRVDGIKKLWEENIPITLSVSLHAPNNKIRDSIMPINKKYPVEVLIDACREYIKKTSRRISFEYSLIAGVNDSRENAKELAKLLGGMLCHVNLIPVNHVEERDYHKGKREDILRFCKLLNDLGINATIRRELGSDISASCGQLRKKVLD